MDRRSAIRVLASALAMGGLAVVLSGCFGIPKGTLKNTSVGTVKIEASGAGIVSADAQKTTFKIKCAVCGYEAETMTIDTPVAGKPYTLAWICPTCGHKQQIVVQVVGP